MKKGEKDDPKKIMEKLGQIGSRLEVPNQYSNSEPSMRTSDFGIVIEDGNIIQEEYALIESSDGK